MDRQSQSQPVSGPSVTSLPQPLVQRQCGCGQHTGGQSECEDCRKRRQGLLQRQASSAAATSVPPIVQDVLQSPGQPLDSATRRRLEPRFGHDFSRVRVHSDARAAESAAAVRALAYTVGQNVVFGAGQYQPATSAGQRLLAHELTHVVQQGGQRAASLARQPLTIGPVRDGYEQEADQIADQIMRRPAPVPIRLALPASLQRKLQVDRPRDPIPNPARHGVAQTNAETIEGYLRRLAPSAGVAVNRTSGEVTLATGYCPGIVGGLLQGAATGYRIGNMIGSIGGRIPLLGPILGAVGAVIGGLAGAVAGIFASPFSGRDSPSRAAASSTPTGSTCLCDFVNGRNTWTIEINDADTPRTLNNHRVRVNSPNSPRIWGATTASGRQQNIDPWLTLGHELCGHAWLEERREPEENVAGGPDSILRHGRTVERENDLRREHGIEPRGYRLKDPYCGESFSRDRSAPDGPVTWQEQRGHPQYQTYLDECQALRDQLPESRHRRYRIDERIP